MRNEEPKLAPRTYVKLLNTCDEQLNWKIFFSTKNSARTTGYLHTKEQHNVSE
jgi:hypothetical protein